MKPKDIDQLIKRIEAQPSDDLDGRIRALLGSRPTARPSGQWSRGLRNSLTRFAVAATVLFALAVGIPFLNGDRSNVWAEALENASKTRNYSYRVVITRETSGTAGTETAAVDTMSYTYVSAGHAALIEDYIQGRLERRSYYLRDSNEVIVIYPGTQEYERRPGIAYHDQTLWDMTEWLSTGRYVELGNKTVYGRTLTGLRLQVPRGLPQYIADWRCEVWFDPETKLPIVGETSSLDKRFGVAWTTRQDQYQFGVQFTAHFFEPNIPEDYTPTVINGLRLFSELADGRYPRRLNRGDIENEIGDEAQIQEAIAARRPPSGRYGYDGIMRAADFFFMAVEKSPDFAYYGARVTAQDSNRVLMYWNGPGLQYQVIWGDLRLETLSEDQLIQCCCASGDSRCLLGFLEKDDGTRAPVLAEYLGQIGNPSLIPALLRQADRWRGAPTQNPFPRAIEAIRRREEPGDPSSVRVAGRLLYANGRGVSHGFIRIGTEAGSADPNGYFTLGVPSDDPQTEYLGYARQPAGTSARLFLWKKESQPAYPNIVLQWVSFVRGRVVDQEGVPQGNVNVGLCPHGRVQPGRHWPEGDETKTDAQGRFAFEGVPVGLPLDVVIGNPHQPGAAVCVQIDDLTPDQKYEVGDIVVKHP
jgi:hypothetical protein